jgi:copper chaperone CopZ
MVGATGQHPSHLGLHLEAVSKPADAQALAGGSAITLLVEGMGCQICALRVRNALLSVEGVLTVSIALEQGLARLQVDAARFEAEPLAAALSAANEGHHRYTARVLQSL